MKRSSWVICLVLLGGCGAVPLAGPVECTDQDDCRTDGQTPELSSADVSSLTALDVAALIGPSARPRLIDQANAGPAEFPDLLSFILDSLLLDLLDPTRPRLDETITYLERLCLEGDDPETFCRRRYGN